MTVKPQAAPLIEDPAQITLNQWQADEARVREAHRQGLAQVEAGTLARLTLHEAATLPGIDLLRGMMAGRMHGPAIGTTMDFTLVELEPGKASFQGTPGPKFLNPMGGMHGGWYATLLDSAVGCAVHSVMPAGRAYTTLELKLNITRAVSAKLPLVRAVGQVIHVGRQVATAEGRLVGPDGSLYAHATTTCLVFEARVPG